MGFPYSHRQNNTSKPEITIKDHKEKHAHWFYISIEYEWSAKEFEELSKYKDRWIEVERMWQPKTRIIPIVVGSLGLVKKGLQNILKRFLVSKTEQRYKK